MEAADLTATSSKVIVQCSDPYDLFDKTLPELQARQPLQKLHWKSTTRPLRSINSLNVSFTREERKDEASNLARRHQIPGLRQTPFVKILLLRCDEKEVYKENTRKEIKQWLKTHGAPTDSKTVSRGQEGHDAFECLILHVVLPGTPAAEQPKSSKHLAVEVNESTDSLNKSKWTSKSSSTIYDKLRADFSSSSKAPFERVVQVRLHDSNSRPGVLSPAESAELWEDFISQLKAAILASFDLRVAQYEADIRDREAQRSLPGWNFCTFFILKEGLARGFENVGLLEDALTVYDELDAGLDDIVQGQTVTGDTDATGSLMLFSNDLKPAIRSALDDAVDADADVDSHSAEPDLSILLLLEQNNFPFDLSKHDYQQRILTNQVSAFDLRSYVFTRKLHLLLRKSQQLVTSNRGRPRSGKPEAQYDVNDTAFIVEKALDFVSFGARALYRDLHMAWGGRDGLSETELVAQEQVISNLVASWKFSALIQICHDCRLSTLLPDALGVRDKDVLHPDHRRSIVDSSQNGTYDFVNGGPPSKFSLNIAQSDNDKETRRQSMMIPLQQVSQQQPKTAHQDPRERLALWTGELLMRLRATLVEIDPRPAQICNLKRSIKVKPHDARGSVLSESRHTKAGLQSASLRLVSSSSTFSMSLFRMLTLLAYQSSILARQTQASRQLLLNLAELELSVGSPAKAAAWLQEIPSVLDIEIKTITDLSVLRVYDQALRRLDQPETLAKCLIALLQACSSGTNNAAMAKVVIDAQSILDGMANVSSRVEHCIRPFDQLFTLHHVARSIHHQDLVDGFALTLSISLNIPCTLHVNQAMSITLSSLEQTEPKNIVLHSRAPTTLSVRESEVVFTSRNMTFGWYDFESICVNIGNLVFRREFKPASAVSSITLAVLPSPIMLYPRTGVLSVSIKPSSRTDLTQARRMRVTIGGNDTDLENVILKLRPATAGCRLNIQAAEFIEDTKQEFEIIQHENGSALKWFSMKRGDTTAIDVPYTMENAMASSMDVRCDILYDVAGDQFSASYVESINPVLPVTVNVQDIFQTGAFFFRFTASSATMIPVTILRWEMKDSQPLQVSHGTAEQHPILTLPRLPASWVARIYSNSRGTDGVHRLPLIIHYECIDEKIQHIIAKLLLASLPENLAPASILFTKHLTRQIPRLWNEIELEQAALLEEMTMWTYEEMNWDEVLKALDHSIRPHAESWLQMWHDKHENISLCDAPAPIRTLQLLVDMPQPALIISTEYVLSAIGSGCLTAGQPVSVDVIIQCRRYTSDALEIQYEVAGSNDVWLVGGRKRGVLSASTNYATATVLLMAQRTGHSLLPSIEIRVRRSLESDDTPVPTFEVEHQSQSQMVMVMPALQSTTIALNATSANGGYVVTDACHRHKMAI